MTPARFPILAMLALLAVTATANAAEVMIYRCTDAKGHLTVRDTPCRAGEKQEAREMLRPRDAPPRPAPVITPTPASIAPASAPRYIVVAPPRPLYECVTPDNQRYTSDTGEGNPRWVPLWTLGYPVWPRHDRFDRGGFQARVGGRFDHGRFDVRIGDRPGRHREVLPRPVPVLPIANGGYPDGTWIRDECHALPPQEVCSRLRDRRYELDRRYNSALQSEREQITFEERGIDARLATDCGDS